MIEKAWRCIGCGHVYQGDDKPGQCDCLSVRYIPCFIVDGDPDDFEVVRHNTKPDSHRDVWRGKTISLACGKHLKRNDIQDIEDGL